MHHNVAPLDAPDVMLDLYLLWISSDCAAFLSHAILPCGISSSVDASLPLPVHSPESLGLSTTGCLWENGNPPRHKSLCHAFYPHRYIQVQYLAFALAHHQILDGEGLLFPLEYCLRSSLFLRRVMRRSVPSMINFSVGKI